MEAKLELIAKFVGEKDWYLGYLTLSDFVLAEFSNHIEKVAPEIFEKYNFLKRIRTNFENLP